MDENKKTLKFFDTLAKGLKQIKPIENLGEKNNIFKKKRQKLRKTATKARMDARVNAFAKGETFDVSQTPAKELEDMDQKVITAIAAKQVDDFLEG